VNEEIYKSEAATNQRNQAIASLMYAYGHIKDNPAQATDIYTKQCLVNVNAKDLATMAATLANGGKNPVTGKQVLASGDVPEVLTVMATAGLYDDSGKWLYDTGLPAKNGGGGGILAVSPGKFGIAVVSPPLDAAGNSVRAQKAIADISNALEETLCDKASRVERYSRRTAWAWAMRESSAALNACSCVMAFSVRLIQSRMS
jgi:glutaminase